MNIKKFSIRNIREYIKNDELARNGTIMFIATLVSGSLSYFYQVYTGRILGPEEYSIFGALFAIFYMIEIISFTLATSATRFVSRFVGEGKQIGFFIKKSIKHSAILGIICSIIFLILANVLTSLFKLQDSKPILILIFILFISWVAPIITGALKGVKEFYSAGIVSISNAGFKLVSGIILLTIGFGVSGALLGLAIGMLISMLISFIYIKPYIRPNNPHEPDFNFKSFYIYSFPVMLAMFAFSVPANMDVILAKYFFSAADAGLYVSVSVLGKIIFFFPSAIYAVMFPMITERYIKGEDTTSILKKGLLYTGSLSGTLALIYVLFPQLVVKIFGQKYIGALPLVSPYGMAIFFFSLIVILMHYHLAIKNMKYIVLLTGFTLLEISLFFVFHSSIIQMVWVFFWSNLIFLLVSLLYTWRFSIGINNMIK